MNTTPYANSLFEQPWWLDIVAPGQWKEAFAYGDGGRVLGRMAYVTDEKGKRAYMPPLTQTLGFWLAPELRDDYSGQTKIINTLYGQLSGFRSAELALSPENAFVLPFRWLGYRMEPAFTFRLTDLREPEALFQAFHKTAKKNIRYARNKVNLSDRADSETLLRLLDATFAAQKRKNPLDAALIRRLVAECGANGHGKYLEARDAEGNVHSCAYFVYDERVCYYLLGASDARYRSSGAQSLILWEGIQFAAERSQVFDFEGSMVEGIARFFQQFGGVCTPYYAVRRVPLLREAMLTAKPYVKRLLGYKI